MRRFLKLYDGDISSCQRDGKLNHSEVFSMCSDECNGSEYSVDSTPSSLTLISKNYKLIRDVYDSDELLTKKNFNINKIDHSNEDDTLQMEYPNCEDSSLFCNSIEEGESGLNTAESAGKQGHTVLQYFEASNLPPLLLPPSSNDLLVEEKFVMPLLGIYEVLKRFHRHLRLSHFRFEDFCLAIKSSNQSPLLAEICTSLTKTLLRADDCNNIIYGPHDVKDSINIYLHSLDYMSWYDTMRCYFDSKSSMEYENVLQLLSRSSFFSNSMDERVFLLQSLIDFFLRTDLARNEISREGSFQHEDQCRLCHKLGDLLCCEMCPAVYHLECVGLVEVPQGDWICAACKQSEVAGVTDCISLAEREGTVSRMTPLGMDRHLREYWFLCRRIFVESETSTVYYSTKDQFEMLLLVLDQESYEKCLYKTLLELKDEIFRQMDITLQLTKNFQKEQHSFFDASRGSVICCKTYSTGIIQSEVSEKKSLESTGLCSDVPDLLIDSKITNKPKLGLNFPKQSGDLSVHLKTSKSLENVITLGKEGALRTRPSLCPPSTHLDGDLEKICCFRLGMEGSCYSYENHYSTNSLSVSRHLHIEEKEKRRHLSYKFSIPLNGEFHWIGLTFGNNHSLINTFKETILELESCLLPHLMLHNWPSKKWIHRMRESSNIHELSHLLVDLQLGIRPVLFNHVWHDALGHMRLKKMCAIDRDEIKRNQKWKFEDEEEEEMPNSGDWVKYSLGVKHQLWKVKGEEYRIFGNGGWIWVGANRKSRHMPASGLGLRNIAQERRSFDELCANLRSSEFPKEHFNQEKNYWPGKCIRDLDQLTLKEDFSICDNILNGNFYLLSRKPDIKLDRLLEERQRQLQGDNELKEYFESLIIEFLKSEVKKSGVMKNGASLVEASIKNKDFKKQVLNLQSQLCRSNDHENEVHNKETSKSDSNLFCKSLTELREMSEAGMLQMSQTVIPLLQSKLHEMLRTDVKVILRKSVSPEKNSLSCSREVEKFPNLNVLSRKHSCLFVLENSLARSLAKKEGKFEVPGFSYNCKTNNVNWPYPAPRPLFKTAWQHRTKNSSSLSALCSHLRIMWACLKWDDLTTKPPSSSIHTTASETAVKATEVLAKRDVPTDKFKSEYFVRELSLPLTDDSKIHEVYTPQRSGLRERKKASLTLLDPVITEKWVSEDFVEIWQIKYLEERLKKDKAQSKDNLERDSPTKPAEDVQADEQNLCQDYPLPQTKLGAQKITVVPKADGQIEIHGLQENQQIIQLSNGDIHIATSIDANDSQNLAFVLGPKIPLPQAGNFELKETKASDSEILKRDSTMTNEEYPGVIPHSPSSVTPQFLLQVVGQILMHTHNSDIREKLLSVQKLLQQKVHPSPSGEMCSEGNSKLNLVGGKVTKNITPPLSQEEKEDQLRMAICGQVIRQLLDTIEKNERLESKTLKKQEITKGKIRQIVNNKLEAELQKRKDEIRRDILYKKAMMEETLRCKIKASMEIEKEQLSTSEIETESNMEEKSMKSQMSSTSVHSDSEASSISPKKKKHKSEADILPSEELFCLCRTPYDSSKFYIGCDQCENWFHGSCVGITKPEAEKLSTYLCPKCRQPSSRSISNSVTFCNSHWQEVEKVVNNLKTHKSAWPFLRPVDPSDAPDYYSIIAEPMDLSTVEKKVLGREYKTLPDFVNDVMKIFENCRYYNARNTRFYKCADILEIYFSDKLRTLRTRLKIF